MGEDIIDMDLNMEGGRKETDEEGKEIAAGTDRSASEQKIRELYQSNSLFFMPKLRWFTWFS